MARVACSLDEAEAGVDAEGPEMDDVLAGLDDEGGVVGVLDLVEVLLGWDVLEGGGRLPLVHGWREVQGRRRCMDVEHLGLLRDVFGDLRCNERLGLAVQRAPIDYCGNGFAEHAHSAVLIGNPLTKKLRHASCCRDDLLSMPVQKVS